MRTHEPGQEPQPPLSSPYGPHTDHVDEASGGADSSPYETLSGDEREDDRQDREPVPEQGS
jgi:hypothetical protein